MSKFRFLHAADLHIDSPLLGLARKSEEFADRINDASRRAFDNLISTAIDEECSFVLICGDLFDGQWRDYRTGLFFADRMRRLAQAGIAVYIILGNHDAENRFASRLELAPNVHLFSRRGPETVPIEKIEAVIHGRSFPQRDVTENLAQSYPAPVPGMFNIGMLHTACTGREGHASYAPCAVEQLVNQGYDYWALGHAHAYEVVHRHPHVVYPGNLQGRNSKETGPKGATLISVEDGKIVSLEQRELDVIRWAVAPIDLIMCGDMSELYSAVRAQFELLMEAADGRGIAVRLNLLGTTVLHNEMIVQEPHLREEVETIAAAVSDEIWIEKIEIATTPPNRQQATDPTIAGRIRAVIEELGKDAAFTEMVEKKLNEIREKMPAAAYTEELFSSIRDQVPAHAIDLALSLIEGGRE